MAIKERKEKSRIRTKEWRKKFPERARESVKKSVLKNREPSRKAIRNWNKKNKIKKAELAKEYRKRKPLEIKARSLAQKIKIPLGEKCELCKIKLAKERHHPDYNSPLEVMFLCVECHRRLHLGK